MKIAVFSDIHANIYAFKASLKDATEYGVTDYFFLGDLITDLPWVNEVYDIVRNLNNVRIIRGNRERMLLDLGKSDRTELHNQMASAYWTYRNLSKINKEYIFALTDVQTFELNGEYFHLNHCPHDIWGQQVSNRLHYFANHTDTHEDYANIMKDAVKGHPNVMSMKNGIYLYGHFHGQWHCRLGETIIINPGSCGMAGDNETRAEYSILNYKDGLWSVDERLVEYNRIGMLKEFRSSELYHYSPVWSEAIAVMIETGRENLHLLFSHLNNVCAARGMSTPYYPYPNDIWDIEGKQWVEEYKNSIA